MGSKRRTGTKRPKVKQTSKQCDNTRDTRKVRSVKRDNGRHAASANACVGLGCRHWGCLSGPCHSASKACLKTSEIATRDDEQKQQKKKAEAKEQGCAAERQTRGRQQQKGNNSYVLPRRLGLLVPYPSPGPVQSCPVLSCPVLSSPLEDVATKKKAPPRARRSTLVTFAALLGWPNSASSQRGLSPPPLVEAVRTNRRSRPRLSILSSLVHSPSLASTQGPT